MNAPERIKNAALGVLDTLSICYAPLIDKKRKAISGAFSDEEMAESRRRVALGIGLLEEALGQREWLGSDSYSLADINGFNLGYALPLSQPHLSNDTLTPNIMRWLRAIYARPATKACWAMGRTGMVKRVAILEPPQVGRERVS